VADHNAIDVTAQDGVVPHAAVRTEGDITEHHGPARNIDTAAKFGRAPQMGVELADELVHASLIPDSREMKTKNPADLRPPGTNGSSNIKLDAAI